MKNRRQKQLLIQLKKQRTLLNGLIARVESADDLRSVSSVYDQTTRQIETRFKDLLRFLNP